MAIPSQIHYGGPSALSNLYAEYEKRRREQAAKDAAGGTGGFRTQKVGAGGGYQSGGGGFVNKSIGRKQGEAFPSQMRGMGLHEQEPVAGDTGETLEQRMAKANRLVGMMQKHPGVVDYDTKTRRPVIHHDRLKEYLKETDEDAKRAKDLKFAGAEEQLARSEHERELALQKFDQSVAEAKAALQMDNVKESRLAFEAATKRMAEETASGKLDLDRDYKVKRLAQMERTLVVAEQREERLDFLGNRKQKLAELKHGNKVAVDEYQMRTDALIEDFDQNIALGRYTNGNRNRRFQALKEIVRSHKSTYDSVSDRPDIGPLAFNEWQKRIGELIELYEEEERFQRGIEKSELPVIPDLDAMPPWPGDEEGGQLPPVSEQERSYWSERGFVLTEEGGWQKQEQPAPVAPAPQAPAPQPQTQQPPLGNLVKYDTNGDGTLDSGERDAARASLRGSPADTGMGSSVTPGQAQNIMAAISAGQTPQQVAEKIAARMQIPMEQAIEMVNAAGRMQ